MTPFISVVIPALDEGATISINLEKISSYLAQKGLLFEVIVVDDGSIDQTLFLAQECARRNNFTCKTARNEKNMGKGYAVRKGILLSTGTYVLISDADLSTPIYELEAFLPYMQQGYDIVIGSRALIDSKIILKQPQYRQYLGKIFNLCVRAITGLLINDTQCGFKLFRGEVARRLFAQSSVNGYCFDVEILFLASRQGCRIKEFPVQWSNSPRTRLSMIRDPLKMFIELLYLGCKKLRKSK